MVLWESVAINEYLVQTYDLSGTLWCRQGPDHFIMKQWLYFQMSGQGPYYGQGLSNILYPRSGRKLIIYQLAGSSSDTTNIFHRQLAATDKRFDALLECWILHLPTKSI